MHPLTERRSLEPAILCGSFVFFTWILAAGFIAFFYFVPVGWYADRSFSANPQWLIKAYLYFIEQSVVHQKTIQALITSPLKAYQCLTITYDLGDELSRRFCIIFGGGLCCAVFTFFYLLPRTPAYSGVEHISGRRLYRGQDAISHARQTLSAQLSQFGSGIELAPGIVLPKRVEPLHQLVMGAIGSGKTIIFRWLIEQYLKRGARLIIHDSKGEYLEGLPTNNFILLAPHNKDSWAWDIGADITTEQSAREFSARLIPNSHDPMWSTAGRAVLTGLIVFLIKTKGKNWGWKDMYEAFFSDAIEMASILSEHYPSASRFIEMDSESGTLSKTSFGILLTIWAAAAEIISPLATCWGDTPRTHRISLIGWLHGTSTNRVLIFQRSAEFAALSAAWIGAAVDILAGRIASPNFPDSDNRLVFALDELAQLGRLQSLPQLMEVGRSKGIALILGIQDREQLRHIYGDPTTSSWMSMIGTKIILRMNSGDSASWISSTLIGSRDVAWTEESKSSSRNGIQTSIQRQRATVPVITPAYIEESLGLTNTPDGIKVRGIALGLGGALEIDWPPTTWLHQRPAANRIQGA